MSNPEQPDPFPNGVHWRNVSPPRPCPRPAVPSSVLWWIVGATLVAVGVCIALASRAGGGE